MRTAGNEFRFWIAIIIFGFGYIGQANAASTRVIIPVSHARADAEEYQNASKSMSLESNRLFFGIGEDGLQKTGVRFDNIPLRKEDVIVDAWIQFSAAESNSEPTLISIGIEETGQPTPFVYGSANLSNRSLLPDRVSWDIKPWHLEGRRGPYQRTPSLNPLVSGLVNSENWTSGQSMVFIFEGTGSRGASSFDDKNWPSPELVIQFSTTPTSEPAFTSLFINEVSGSWNTVPDETGDYTDWIEIYNPNNFEISGLHLFLSDRIEQPDKWALSPQTVIPAKGHAVIFADDEPDKGVGHAAFSISSSGEPLILSVQTPSGMLELDRAEIPELRGIPSYGRVSDGAAEWIHMGNPSLGSANSATHAFVAAPNISPVTGRYQGAVSVELASPEPNSVIYFTLDGSMPSSSSFFYSEPILVESTKVVRAIAVTPGKADSPVTSQTYLINEPNDLPVITLTVNPEDLFSNEEGIYVKGTTYGLAQNCDQEPANWNQPWQKPSQVTWINEDGSIGFEINGGIEIAGQCTRRFRQKTLEVKTKSRWGSSDIPFPIFENRAQNSYRRFKLRGSGNDWSSTMLRDGFVHDWLEKSDINLEVQGYRPVEVYINGLFWGLHNVRDVHSKHSINEKFPKVTKSKVDLVKKYRIESYNFDRRVQTGSPDAYKDLQNFLENHSMDVPANWERLKQMVDFESAVNYHLVEIFVGNHDWPDSNVGLWREDKEGEKWRFLLFDLDDGFGYSSESKDEASYNSLRDALDGVTDEYPISKVSTLMFRRLMEAPEYRNEFIQRMATMMATTFNPDLIGPAIDATAARIEPVMERHIQFWNEDIDQVIQNAYGDRFPSPNLGIEDTVWSFDGWKWQVKKFKDYWSERIPYVREHIKSTLGVSGTFRLTINNSNKSEGEVLLNLNRTPIGQRYSAVHFADVPMRIEAVPATGYRFVRWAETGSTDPVIQLETQWDKEFTPIFEFDDIDMSYYDGLIISELHYNPGNTELLDQEELEFIEFGNIGTHSIDMGGMQIGEAFETYTIPYGTSLSPGGTVVLARNPNFFKSYKPAYHHYNIIGPWAAGKLSNKGETLSIAARNRVNLFSLTWSDKDPWPIEADGAGKSLQFTAFQAASTNPADKSAIFSASENWKASTNDFGSPGRQESPSPGFVTFDGDISEWTADHIIGTDPQELNPATNPIDILQAYFKFQDDNYHFGFINTQPIELNYGWAFFLNSGDNNTLFDLSDFFADYLVQDGKIYKYGGDGKNWDWDFVAEYQAAQSSQMIEFLIPGDVLPKTGEWQFLFIGDNGAFDGEAIDHGPDQSPKGNFWPITFDNREQVFIDLVLDGDISEWPESSKVFDAGSAANTLGDIQSARATFDLSGVHFGLGYKDGSIAGNSGSFWIDIDGNASSGYPITPDFGADLLIENAALFRYLPEEERKNGVEWEFASAVSSKSNGSSREISLPWSHLGKVDNINILITRLDESGSPAPVHSTNISQEIFFVGDDPRPEKVVRSGNSENALAVRIPLISSAPDQNQSQPIITNGTNQIYVSIPESGNFQLESSSDLNGWTPEWNGSGTPGLSQKFHLNLRDSSTTFIRILTK